MVRDSKEGCMNMKNLVLLAPSRLCVLQRACLAEGPLRRTEGGISLVVKRQFSKLWSGVRFSHPAQTSVARLCGKHCACAQCLGRIEGRSDDLPAGKSARQGCVAPCATAHGEHLADSPIIAHPALLRSHGASQCTAPELPRTQKPA